MAAAVVALTAGLILMSTRPWDSKPSAATSVAPSTDAPGPASTVEMPTAGPPPHEPPSASSPTSAAAPPPVQSFALPGCTKGGAAAIKPDLVKPTCNRQHWIEGLTWTEWGANGAAGTGIEEHSGCDPSCAEGEISRNRVQVLFTGKISAPVGSGCPSDLVFYSQMVVAYPDRTAVPFELGPTYAVTTRYNGLPAIRYNHLDVNCDAGPQL